MGRDRADFFEIPQEVGAAETVAGLAELPVEGQSVVDHDAGVVGEDSHLADRVGASGHRGVDERVGAGGQDVHPAGVGPDPVGGLIGVEDRHGLQQRDQRRDERGQAPRRVGVEAVDRTLGDPYPVKVGHRLLDPFDGDVLAGQQVHDDSTHPRREAHRGPHPVGEHPCGGRPARTPARDRAVLGHDRSRFGQIDHLASGLDLALDPREILTAARALLGSMVDHLIRVRGLFRSEARAAALLALLAGLRGDLLLSASLAFLSLALTFRGGVTR